MEDEEDIELVNSVIFNELCKGIIKDSSRSAYASIIEKLKNVIGCESFL
ncbi:hypothetical protein [Oribacterium sp. P6A1]|nr:hypothetical protein [Oribacterium sp. P6A1]